MSTRGPLERMVAAWMADEAVVRGAVTDQVVDQILSTTGRQRPRPRWLALLKESPMTAQARVAVGSPTGRLAFAVVLIVLAAVAVIGVGAAILLRPQPIPDDWTGFRGGPGHTGLAPSGPTGNPVVRWRVDLGAPVRTDLAVVGDLVIAPSDNGVLHALSIVDGSERWSFRPGTSMTGPTVANGAVYVTDGTGTVRAVDLATGTERWRSTSPINGATSSVAADGAFFVGTGDGQIQSLELASGAQRWRATISTDGQPAGAPAYADGMVYAGTTQGLVALRAATGDLVWRLDLGGDPFGSIVIADGVAYVGPGADVAGGHLRAVDAKTGQLRWMVDEGLSSPSVTGSTAVSVGAGGIVSARDTATGQERWRFVNSGTNRAPAIANGTVYLPADTEQRIYALDAATGNVFWQSSVVGGQQCCIAVARGMVFAATTSGSVYAIGGDGSALVAQPYARASVAPSSTPTPIASPSAVLPDPFTVVAQHSAASLELDRPLSLAVGPTGDIYATDRSDHVTEIAPDGRVVRRWGGEGSKTGQFDFNPAGSGDNPQGSIAVGLDGKVYVSDSDNHRVQVFTADGTFVRTFGSFGEKLGQFTIPFDLNADADGNVYVLDDSAQNLQKFSPTGTEVWIASRLTDPRLDGHGHTAAFDPQGRIVVSNDDNGQVVYLDPNGTVVDSFVGNGCDATVDAAGNVYVDDCGGGHVTVFDPTHRAIGTSSAGIGSPRFGPAGEAVSLGSDGSIVILKVTLPKS